MKASYGTSCHILDWAAKKKKDLILYCSLEFKFQCMTTFNLAATIQLHMSLKKKSKSRIGQIPNTLAPPLVTKPNLVKTIYVKLCILHNQIVSLSLLSFFLSMHGL